MAAVTPDNVNEQDGLQPMQRLVEDDEPEASTEPLPSPLTPEEIRSFTENGYVLLKGAFTREAAAAARACLWDRIVADGITRNPATWTRRHGIAEVYGTDGTAPWDAVITPKLRGAIDQLCGQGRTGRFGCGWWVVTFPEVAEPPSGVDGKWYNDAT
jgi:hypothetical protein